MMLALGVSAATTKTVVSSMALLSGLFWPSMAAKALDSDVQMNVTSKSSALCHVLEQSERANAFEYTHTQVCYAKSDSWQAGDHDCIACQGDFCFFPDHEKGHDDAWGGAKIGMDEACDAFDKLNEQKGDSCSWIPWNSDGSAGRVLKFDAIHNCNNKRYDLPGGTPDLSWLIPPGGDVPSKAPEKIQISGLQHRDNQQHDTPEAVRRLDAEHADLTSDNSTIRSSGWCHLGDVPSYRLRDTVCDKVRDPWQAGDHDCIVCDHDFCLFPDHEKGQDGAWGDQRVGMQEACDAANQILNEHEDTCGWVSWNRDGSEGRVMKIDKIKNCNVQHINLG